MNVIWGLECEQVSLFVLKQSILIYLLAKNNSCLQSYICFWVSPIKLRVHASLSSIRIRSLSQQIMFLPTTDTSMFRLQILFVTPSKVFNSHVNNPSSAVVTLKILRAACWATQLTLNLEVKDALGAAFPVDGIMVPTEVPSSFIVTKIRLSSLVRPNSQFKWTLVDPLRSFEKPYKDKSHIVPKNSHKRSWICHFQKTAKPLQPGS